MTGKDDESVAVPQLRPVPRRALVTDLSLARWLLVIILAASAYFFYGFIVPVLAATVIAFASWPILLYLDRRLGLNRKVAAGLLVLLIVLFIVVPVGLALFYARGELQSWIRWASAANSAGAPAPEWLGRIPQVGEWLSEKWTEEIGHRGVLTVGNLAFQLALTLVFMLIALFIFFRDGEKLVAQIDRVGRRILQPERWNRLSRIVPATITATVTGMTLIAIGEGVVLGVAYWIAGVSSPVILGVITAFMALVPGGAPLAFTLVSVYLMASSSSFAGLALFSWGCIELFVVDKTIRPMLVGGPVKLPFLPTFFGLIGGVETMGIVGLFIGPVLMALIVAMWREWQREIEVGAQPKP